MAKSAMNDNLYINREISWLNFNKRVLEEANNTHHPLLERLKFLAISGSNLDEFSMVRIAGLENQTSMTAPPKSIDDRSPEAQLALIYEEVEPLIRKQQQCWKTLREALAKKQITLLSVKECSGKDKAWLKTYFQDVLLPKLDPVIPDADTPFPILPNLGFTLAFALKQEAGEVAYGVVPIPKKIPRCIALPRKQGACFVCIDEVVLHFSPMLFPKHTVIESGMVRVIRDSELQLSDEADDLIRSFEHALRKRVKANIIRLEVMEAMDESIIQYVVESLGADSDHIVSRKGFMGFGDLVELYSVDRPDLKFPPLTSRFPERIADFDNNCLAAIAAKDILVHHPYESFDVVVQFIRQAASDPDVTEIKQTLYRTSSDSPIVTALIEAAEQGKSVTVVIEPKARFDEEANLTWGKGLLAAGAKVIFGMPNLKIHAKTTLITRYHNDEFEQYVHYGTGNYHPVTARVYTDLSFFTCNPLLCRDTERLFEYIETQVEPGRFDKAVVAPFHLRSHLLALIDEEKAHAKAGRPAAIWLKLNSLVDKVLINALYSASQAGVIVTLIVRGICCLRPGMPGISDNIRVKSIVGRFLEHSRIFCFGNGHPLPSDHSKVFISSADWMPRNMDYRIEMMTPIENPTVHEQVLKQIMAINVRDEAQSWMMQPDGSYIRDARKEGFSAHDYFIANPSLSGRGSALYGPDYKKLLDPPASQKIAVLDIGSNSVRLVIYDALKRAPLPVFNEKLLCGLARDIGKTGKLNAEALELAHRCLDRYAHITQAMEVKRVFAFATSAVRDAEDGKPFLSDVKHRYGLDVQILSGEEEARLAALGVASSCYETDGVVGDLGGGSLELAKLSFLRDSVRPSIKIDACESYPIGSLRLYSATNGRRQKAQAIIEKYLKQFPFDAHLKNKTFYAVGGGFRALAKIHIGLEGYPLNILQNYAVPTEELLDTVQQVATLTPSKIRQLPQASVGRVDTLALAALLLERILVLGKPEQVVFSVHGVREGMLFDQLPVKVQHTDGLLEGCKEIVARISPDRNEQWVQYGEELYEWMDGVFTDETMRMQRLRKAACILSWIAWYENSNYRAEMAFRWILDADLPAVDHWERIFIATAVFYRYTNKDNPKVTDEIHSLMKKKWIKRAQAVGTAMNAGYNFSGSALSILKHTSLTTDGNQLALQCSEQDQVFLNVAVQKRLEKLAKLRKLDGVVVDNST